MKKNIRIAALLMAVMLFACLMVACNGGQQPAPSTNAGTPTTAATTAATAAKDETTASTEVVKLADQVVKIVSFDKDLVTLQAYAVEGDTVDFLKVDLSKLGEPGEMELLYIEGEVSVYSVVSGKLEDAVVEDVVSDCIVGITSYSDGMVEVYILSQPDDNGDETYEDVDIIEEEAVPEETTVPADVEEPEGDA